MNWPLQGGWGSSPCTSQPPGARAPLGHNCPRTPWQSCLASTHWTPDRTGLPHSLQHPRLRPEQHRRRKRPPASGSREASTQPISPPPVSLTAFSVCPHGLFSPSAWGWVQHLDLDQQAVGVHRQGLQQARRVLRTCPTAFQKLQMPKQEKACASLAKTASTRAVAAGYNQALHVQKAQGVTGPQRFSRHVGASHLVGPLPDETEGGPCPQEAQFPRSCWKCGGCAWEPPRCRANPQGHV